MRELREIVQAWRRASPEAEIVLATVIEIQGSTYRRPGARLLIVDGVAHGSISGGCLESDLISTAWERTSLGPTIAVFDTTSDEDAVFGYGMGCRGIVTVFLRRLSSNDFQLGVLERQLDSRESTTFIVDVEGESSGQVSTSAHPVSEFLPERIRAGLIGPEGSRQFVEEVEPVLNLHIYGAGFDAVPLARIADELGWTTFVYDHRPALAMGDRFPESCRLACVQYTEMAPPNDPFSAHVVMTHNFEKDKQILERIVPNGFYYLGVLGPRARTRHLLRDSGYEHVEEVRTPVGLDIGAETPHEIALAIAAEIQAILRSRRAGFLKDRPQRIHQEVAAV